MSDPLQPGQIFAGRYRIEKFLAKGGFGAVYVAEQTETELRVALKVLWPHVLHSEDAVEKFKLEARVAGRVGSEHIVRVFDAGFDAETRMPFLVMELLQGEDLEKVVASRGPIPRETVLTYFRQIASALDKAHGYVDRNGAARPIVHRDLKPENLYLSHRETGDPIVKVLDFGIAKVLGESTNVSQDVKGTPLYMAFEQATGGAVTPRTDVWALGLIAFYLLTGKCYWKTASAPEASLTQLFGEVLSLPLSPPTERARELGSPVALPTAFDDWFTRCVNRDPSQRFATAGECAAGLASVLLGAPSTRPSPGAFQAGALDATVLAPSAPQAASAASRPPSPSAAGVPVRGGSTEGALGLGATNAPPVKSQGPLFFGLGVVVLLLAGGGMAVSALVGSSGRGADVPSASAAAAGPAPGTPDVAPSLNVPADSVDLPVAAPSASVAAAPSAAPAVLSGKGGKAPRPAAPVASAAPVATPAPGTARPAPATAAPVPAASDPDVYGER